MRMHSVSPGPSPGVSNNSNNNINNSSNPSGLPTITNGEQQPSDIQDRYCQDCDIRFSSLKTFRAHKMHYCSTRHIVKPSGSLPPASSCTSGSGPSSPVDSSPACKTPPSPSAQQALLALPTNPILIVPYALFRGASLLPGPSVVGMPNPDTPCFLLPNGTLQPMSHAIAPTTAAAAVQTASNCIERPPSSSSNSNSKQQQVRDPSAPLDLSVRRSPEPAMNDLVIDMGDEENSGTGGVIVDGRSDSPEQIVCAPSLCGSPSVTPSPPSTRRHESRSSSPRPSRQTVTPKSVDSRSPEPKLAVPAALHPILMRAAPLISPEMALRLAADLQVQSPQVLVKQGVSKCKECNIVFCKLENYVAHKKHYCQARLQNEDGGDAASRSPPTSPANGNGSASPGAAPHYQQLICMACGIKFTSMDNLSAHQTYYCLKRNELQKTQAERCGKCKGPVEAGHQCSQQQQQTQGQRAGWKCPCCDVVSLTVSGAQRHMETHTGVKAYRCTICKYKGNTLRGMKTHIRMHFEKKTADLQVCISFIFQMEQLT